MKNKGTIFLLGCFVLSQYIGYGQKSTGAINKSEVTVPAPKPIDWGYFANGTLDVIFSSHNDIAWFDTPAETIARRDHACITPALARMEYRDDVYFGMESSL